MATKLSKRRRRRGGALLVLVSIVMLLAAISLFVVQLLGFSQGEERLPASIRMAGVDVGGLTAPEAASELEQIYAAPIVLYYQNSPIVLNPDTIGFRIRTEAMLADALASSEQDGGFWPRFINYLLGQESTQALDIPLTADYQLGLLEQFLADVAVRYDERPGEAGFDVQTLTIFQGDSGVVLNQDTALALVDRALRSTDNRTVALPLTGDDPDERPGLETLEALIIEYLNSVGFIYDGQSTVASIFIMDLSTGEEVNIMGDVAFSAASTIKVGILVDFFRSISRPPNQDEAWLLANSLLCSQNSSSNLLMRILGNDDQLEGLRSVTNTLQETGIRNSYITAPFIEYIGQPPASIAAPETSPNPNFNTGADPFNQTTAEDLGNLFTLIYDCANYNSGLAAIYPESITSQECGQMLELMSANDLLRLLQGGLPPDVRISHKNGWIFDTVGDAGVVFPPNGRDYVISVFLWEQAEFQNYEELWPIVEEISRAAWNYFSPEEALLTRRTDLPRTAQECYRVDEAGNIVEYVYLPPGPEAVDLNNINGWRSP